MSEATDRLRPSSRRQQGGTRISAWYGLRYAATAERFAPPLPASGRLEVDHLSDVPIFPQRPSRLAAAMGHGRPKPQDEDAFFLNIWAPADADALPVLLFVHGGAWMTGGGAMDWYDGGKLASGSVVVVSINYRLGALGHLGRAEICDLPVPAADVLTALRWTCDHIRAFGGDPDRITLAGQSAGGWYAHLMSVLPQTRGLVHRLSLQSMGTRTPWSPQRQAEMTRRTAEALGDEDIETAPVDRLLDGGAKVLATDSSATSGGLGYAPSAFLPVASIGLPRQLLDPQWAAENCHAKAVHLRVTSDESATFFFTQSRYREATQEQVDSALSAWDPADLPAVLLRDGRYAGGPSGLSPYRQLVAASSWRQFQRFSVQYHAMLAAQGLTAHLDTFTEESALSGLHCGHCLDLPFQFGTWDAWQDAPMLAGFDQERRQVISDRMMGDLLNFVKG